MSDVPWLPSPAVLRDIEDVETWLDLLPILLLHGLQVLHDGLIERRNRLVAAGDEPGFVVERRLLAETKTWFRRYFSDAPDSMDGEDPRVRQPKPVRPAPQSAATAAAEPGDDSVADAAEQE